MEHQDWIDLLAAESYTLGELEPAKRDAFEEHFFDCPVCSNDVRDAAKVVAGIRTRDVRAITPAAPRLKWWAVAASVLAAGLSYQSFWVMPHMRAAQAHVAPAALAEVITLESASRGTNEQIVRVVRADEAVVLTFPIETNEPQPLYICEVRDDAGKTRASLSVPRAKASEPVLMVLAPHTLPSGNYKLVIRGGDREIAAYPFTVEVR